MNKIYSLAFLITCFVALNLSKGFTQSLTQLGNSNFPINDNTSVAPTSAINSGWQINGIGKIITIVQHPTLTTTLYACTSSGGLYITTNSGTSWSPMHGSFLPGVQFGCLAIDPGNTNIMYAGSGEPSYAQVYGWGGYGTFKSTNGGVSWTQINTGMGNVVVLDVIVNPANTQEIVAATNNGIFKSSNAGASWAVVMSAAGSWVQQVIRQGSGNNLVAAGATRFYRSTDFGNTWATSDLDPAFSSTFANGRVAVAASNSNIVYAGWVNNTFSNANNASLYYSTDGGVSFIKKYAFTDPVKLISYDGSTATGYGWANFILTISKTDPNTIYVGGHLIFKSTNNGVNWTLKTPNWYCCIHTDIRQLIFDPNNINRILAATDGGVFASTNDAVDWVQVSNGLYCNQYMSMGQSNIEPDFVIGGLQDNGIIYNNEDGNYHTYTGGDVYDHMTCDYTNSFNVYSTYNAGKIFNPYNRSQVANLNLPSNIYNTGGTSRQSFFISPLDPVVAFGWGTNVWRSSNVNSYSLAAGSSSISWTQISSFAVTIQDVKISPASNNVVYALGDNAIIYKSINATAASPTFTPISLPGGASSSIEGSLTVSTLNPNVLYAAANNTVYRSSNAGATWTNYTAMGLPSINFTKIFVDPYSSIESVYLVTALGIYYRDLTMSSWITVNPQVPGQQQNSAASYAGLINGTSLFKGSGSSNSHISFATWGSGIWKAGFYNQLNNLLPEGWSNTDIGSPAISGNGFFDNTKLSYNVKGAGTGINSSSTDQFNFTKATVSGTNGDMIAKIYSVAETDPINGLSKTGLMFRTSINTNAPYVMISLTGHAGAVFQYRVNAGDVATVATTSPAPTDAYPYWLRLNKASNVITAYISPDGNTWTQVGQVTVALGTSFLAGIANTSNNAAAVNNASVGSVAFVSFVIPIQNIVLRAVLKDKNKVALAWSFDSNERNNLAGIERSTDGINFTPLYQKTYINNNSSQQTFNDALVDEAPFKGKNYYRLKTTGQDGQVKFSNTQQVNIDQDFLVQIEPNPVHDNSDLKIIVSGGPASKIIFNIYDLAGRTIQSEVFTNAGVNTIHLKTMSAGTYFYKLMYEHKAIPGKLLVTGK